MSREQDIGNTPSLVLRRTGIDGRSQQIVLKRIGKGRLLVTDCTGNDPDNRIGNHGSSKFTAGQYEVANGDLPGHQVLPDPVVHSLVVTTEDYEVFLE
jgi:hypothetical protein